MKRWVFMVVLVVSVGSFSLGVFSAYALQRISYASGQLNSSAEWYRQVAEIEQQLARDGVATVGGWRLVVEKKGKKVVRVGR